MNKFDEILQAHIDGRVLEEGRKLTQDQAYRIAEDYLSDVIAKDKSKTLDGIWKNPKIKKPWTKETLNAWYKVWSFPAVIFEKGKDREISVQVIAEDEFDYKAGTVKIDWFPRTYGR
jgi:hypothetical protein